MIFYLWNDCDPGPEPAQAQLGDVNAIDGDWTAGCLDNPFQLHKSGLCASRMYGLKPIRYPDMLFQFLRKN